MNPNSRLQSLSQSTAHFLERFQYVFLALLIALVTGIACQRSLSRSLWFDEVLTAQMSSLGSTIEVWNALFEVCDTNPPLYYVLLRVIRQLISNVELAVRIPSILGGLILMLSTFFIVRRRATVPVALFATSLLPLTIVPKYLREGRPYGLVLGLAALAFCFWQQAGTETKRGICYVLLTLTLALLISVQYYAGLVFIPLAIGESVRILQNKRINFAIALCFLLGSLPLLIFLPLIRQLGSLLPAYWSRVGALDSIYHSYGYIFASAVTPLVCVGIILFLAITLLYMSERFSLDFRNWPLPEVIAIACFLALPIIGVTLSQAGTGIFTSRYALPAVLGLSLGAAFCLTLFKEKQSLLAMLGLSINIPFLLHSTIRQIQAPPFTIQKVVTPLSESDTLPIVFSNGLTFLPQAFYHHNSENYRPVYLADPKRSVAATGADTNDRILVANAGRFPLEVLNPEEFLATTEEFLLFENTGWLLAHLDSTGAYREPLKSVAGRMLFLVKQSNQP